MALTKKKALKICVELWTWMKTQKHWTAKAKWPGWEKYGEMIEHCPCCDYAERNCKKCPLKSFWPDGCRTSDSPYERFSEGRGTPKDAQKIINAARKELKKLK